MKFIKRFFLLALFLLPLNAYAAASLSEGSLIRDAEIEDVLESYIKPIFKVAGLEPDSLTLYIVNSKEVNAFAMGGGRIGVHTALLLRANSALQVIGVFAHETAHLAGNHVARGVEDYKNALLKGLIGALGGIAIGALNPEAGTAIMMGSQDMAMRSFLKFRRDQEGAADQGAARYLDSLKWSSKGMVEFMNILHKDTFYIQQDLDPYLITHPFTNERLDFFRSHLSKSPHSNGALPSDFEGNFKRIQVKIAAFTEPPGKTLNRFKPTDNSLLARYGRSIAYLQNSHNEEALKEVDSLLREYPEDAFFWDLKGQILFEAGQIKEAAAAYEKSVQLRPDIPLLRINWAHALTESNDNALIEKAYNELMRAKTEEPDNPFTYRLLAVYYGKSGKTGLAALSLAEMAYHVGEYDKAEEQAERSIKLLKGDKENTLRAQEILDEVQRLKDDGWRKEDAGLHLSPTFLCH